MTAKGCGTGSGMVETTSFFRTGYWLSICRIATKAWPALLPRIRESLANRCLYLTKAEEGVKGSGRSIEAITCSEMLTKCKELLDKIRGHPWLQAFPCRKKMLNPSAEN